jgi:hypothetical protein
MSFVVLGYINEVVFLLINSFLLFLSVYPGVPVLLVDCCGVVAGSRQRGTDATVSNPQKLKPTLTATDRFSKYYARQ